MKKIISFVLIIATMLFLFISCNNSTATSGTHHVEMTFEGFGTITIELYGDIAPITVDNFMKLAKSGYYDNNNIVRIQPGFVIQGGQGSGTSTIKGEFKQNGVDNTLSHEKYVISMARSSDYNSASDQFFICLDSTTCIPSLDGLYAGFGKVVKGTEVIDAIENSFSYDKIELSYSGYQMGFLNEASYIKITKTVVVD